MIDIKADFNKNGIEGVACGTGLEFIGETIMIILYIYKAMSKRTPESAKLYINAIIKFLEEGLEEEAAK